MEQGRRETVPVPAEVWGLAAVEKEKGAARDKAVAAARGKAKVKVKVKAKAKAAAKLEGRAADKIRRPPLDQ